MLDRLSAEARLLDAMIREACRRHGPVPLCPACAELTAYARGRLAGCRYGEAKPACRTCPTHCYRPDRQAQIREVMRTAGPTAALRHPWLAVRHLAGF